MPCTSTSRRTPGRGGVLLPQGEHQVGVPCTSTSRRTPGRGGIILIKENISVLLPQGEHYVGVYFYLEHNKVGGLTSSQGVTSGRT